MSDYPGELQGGEGFVHYSTRAGISHRVKTRAAAAQLDRRRMISPDNLAAFLPLLTDGAE